MIGDLISAAILALVALALGAWAGSEALETRRTEQWPTVPGLIEESRGTNPHKPAFDQFHLSYRYAVAGTEHVGHRVRIGDEGKEGTRRARIYPEGRKLAVYYDPADPTSAVLERGALDFSTYLKAGVALALLALVAHMVQRALRPRRV